MIKKFREYNFLLLATTVSVRSPAGGEVPRFHRSNTGWNMDLSEASVPRSCEP
jgi:hypothetical protein